jgi:hypothetical protein
MAPPGPAAHATNAATANSPKDQFGHCATTMRSLPGRGRPIEPSHQHRGKRDLRPQRLGPVNTRTAPGLVRRDTSRPERVS